MQKQGEITLPEKTTIESGSIKWFDLKKGYGFLVLENQKEEDAFIHIETVNAAGYYTLTENMRLACKVTYGDKGAHVLSIEDVLEGEIQKLEKPSNLGKSIIGHVKWFKEGQGFGFIVPENGGDDIFIHRKILRLSGLAFLKIHQKVKIYTTAGDRGAEALWIEEVD